MKRFRFDPKLIAVPFLVGLLTSAAFAEDKPPLPANAVPHFIPQDKKQATGPDTILLIDDFNHLHSLNLMGGITQGKEEEPGGLIPSFTPSGPFTMGRLGHSLKMDYNVQLPASIAFYWSRFGPFDPDSGPGAFFPMNLTGFNYLSFWMKTAKDYPRFALEIHRDTNDDHLFTLGKDQNSKIAVSSFILQPTDAISGNTAEAVISANENESVAQPPPHPAYMTEGSEAPGAAAPAKEDLPAPVPAPEFHPLSKGTNPNAPERRSQKKKFFYYSAPTSSPEEQAAEKALIKPVSKIEQDAENAMIRPVSSNTETKSKGVASQILGSEKGGKVVMAPETVSAVREQKARWRKVVVPLSRFQLVNDWSNILEMVLVFDNRLGSDQGISYIDDITFGTNYVEPTPEFNLKTKVVSLQYAPARKGMSPATIRAVEMGSRQEANLTLRRFRDEPPPERLASDVLSEAHQVARERIKRLFEMEHLKEFTAGSEVPELILLYFKVTPPVEPGLESIRLEVSRDGGKTWNIVTSLYDHQKDGEYVFPWRVLDTDQNTPLVLRLVASDIWGRSLPITDPIPFKRESGK